LTLQPVGAAAAFLPICTCVPMFSSSSAPLSDRLHKLLPLDRKENSKSTADEFPP
jgi:hypothetical protein